jgi:zinc/manganese transport system substrate-binding protein
MSHRPTSLRLLAVVVLTTLAGALAVGCGASGSSGDNRPTVVATTSILGDLVQRVGGDAIHVEVLMPPGADPHEFEASASQAARMRSASLIVANGLGLEERLASTLDSARADGVPVFDVGVELDPQPLLDGGADTTDPHVWLDPDRMATTAGLVATRIAETTGVDRTTLDANAATYAAEARRAGAEADAILSTVPTDRRVLVTNHDALGYFARRFDLRVLGAAIPGGSTLAEPSAAMIRHLADVLRASGVDAVFSESTVSPRIIETVAREVGRQVVVVELPTDSLGEPGSEFATYPDLITTIAHRIADALTVDGAR